MKSHIDKSNSLTKQVQSWKEHQGMVSLSFDELKKEVGDQEIFASEKIDGELGGMEYTPGDVKFSSKDGRIRQDMPVSNEIETILKKEKVRQAIIFGELAKTSSHGKPVHFNDTESTLRKPELGEEEHIEFFPFEVHELDNKEVSSSYEDYKTNFEKLEKWFGKSKHIYPVDHKIGKVSDLKSVWNKWVEKEKNEGIVVRTADGKIYKSKPVFTLDLGVLAVQEGRGKNKGRMGALILGFYDGKQFYKVINLGVGFTDTDRDEWWKLAKKYEIKKENGTIWVDPFKMNKVIETSYERLNYRPVNTFEFKDKSWEKIEDQFAATISKPGFVRERTDKDINAQDLRLSQLPDYAKMKKNFLKSSKLFIISESIIRSVVGGNL
ncbi:MAG: hypothetical protein PHF86_06705 [Candidatus Nanoarchaeia archaeon]|jgi:DNA ligase-1|nr:hypothetical protein [Candidatus Nanoarchaeia archaeon]